MSNLHTRKTFFSKALAALAGLGLLGAGRLTAKPNANAMQVATSGSEKNSSFTLQPDSRSVARSIDSL